MKLLHSLLSIKAQESAVYRENVMINFAFGLIPLFINIYLWKAIYGSQQTTIAGYDFTQMITYFVLVFILLNMTSARSIAVNLSELIREGTLNNYFLKPVNFITYQFKLFFAEKIIYIVNIFIPFIIFFIIIRKYLFFNSSYAVLFLVSVLLAMILNYIIYFILGILTIWLEEISALLDLWGNITSFLSGGIFPLTLLSDNLFTFISILPFKYMVFTPIDIYMGNLLGEKLVLQLIIQIAWIFVLGVLLKIIWEKAIKKYSGYGS